MVEPEHVSSQNYRLELGEAQKIEGLTRADLDRLIASPRFTQAMRDEFRRQIHIEHYEQRIQQATMTSVPSSSMYPTGWALGSCAEQAQQLAERFPGLDVSAVDALTTRFGRQRPEQGSFAYGGCLVPKPSALMRLKPETKHSDWPTYHRAAAWLLGEVKRQGTRWTGGLTLADNLDLILHQLLPETLMLRPETLEAYDQLESLPGDVMLFDAQMGIFHRGEPVPLVRSGLRERSEFGLCPYSVMMLLIGNPGRLKSAEDLGIDCAGADWRPTKGVLSVKDASPGILSWHVHDKKLVLSAYSGLGCARAAFGSATGRLIGSF